MMPETKKKQLSNECQSNHNLTKIKLHVSNLSFSTYTVCTVQFINYHRGRIATLSPKLFNYGLKKKSLGLKQASTLQDRGWNSLNFKICMIIRKLKVIK